MNKGTTEEIELKILDSCAKATGKAANMNRKLAKDSGEDNWSEYEATFVAMLYHELVQSGIDYWRISLENRPDTNDEKYKDKKIDLWVEADDDLTYMIEAKLISYREKSKGLRRMNSMGGVKGDLDKLKGIIKNRPSMKGVAIGAYTGRSNVSLQQIKDKVEKDTKSYLSDKVKLIVSIPKECDFV
jgi:hypothetical protein